MSYIGPAFGASRSIETRSALLPASSDPISISAPRKRNLKKRSIESPRKQRLQLNALAFPREISHHDLHIPAKLPKDLPASPAGRRQRLRIGHHSHSGKPARALRNRLENSHPLCANGQPVSRILHIAAGMNPPGIVLHSRANPELRKRRVRVLPNSNGSEDEGVIHADRRTGRGNTLA
jgi:hypothetical protein